MKKRITQHISHRTPRSASYQQLTQHDYPLCTTNPRAPRLLWLQPSLGPERGKCPHPHDSRPLQAANFGREVCIRSPRVIRPQASIGRALGDDPRGRRVFQLTFCSPFQPSHLARQWAGRTVRLRRDRRAEDPSAKECAQSPAMRSRPCEPSRQTKDLCQRVRVQPKF